MPTTKNRENKTNLRSIDSSQSVILSCCVTVPTLITVWNNLVLELDNMTRLADKCNIQVPMEVLNLIADGKNPDESFM
ncbi:hypothetical protein ACS0TY_029625 [Phlomoides rotata]